MAADVEDLLQLALDLGFKNNHLPKLLDFIGSHGSRYVTANQVMAHVDQLQCIKGGSKHKAVQQLGKAPSIFGLRVDFITAKVEHMQRICEASPLQVAAMVGNGAGF